MASSNPNYLLNVLPYNKHIERASTYKFWKDINIQNTGNHPKINTEKGSSSHFSKIKYLKGHLAWWYNIETETGHYPAIKESQFCGAIQKIITNQCDRIPTKIYGAHTWVEWGNMLEGLFIWEQSVNVSKKKWNLSWGLKNKSRISQAWGRLCQVEGTAFTKAWSSPHSQGMRLEKGVEEGC